MPDAGRAVRPQIEDGQQHSREQQQTVRQYLNSPRLKEPTDSLLT